MKDLEHGLPTEASENGLLIECEVEHLKELEQEYNFEELRPPREVYTIRHREEDVFQFRADGIVLKLCRDCSSEDILRG